MLEEGLALLDERERARHLETNALKQLVQLREMEPPAGQPEQFNAEQASAAGQAVFHRPLSWNQAPRAEGGSPLRLAVAATLFFTSVQVLTRLLVAQESAHRDRQDRRVVLELWAIGVVTAVAGSFSTFFASGDS